MTDHSDLVAELRANADAHLRGVPLARRVTMEQLSRAADALSSQSLSLSEAREEIERLKGLVAGIREIPARTIDAPQVSEWVVLANARRICGQRFKRLPNWSLAMEAFGLGSTWAGALCLRVGVDPDGRTMEKRP